MSNTYKVVLQYTQPDKGFEEVYYASGSDAASVATLWSAQTFFFVQFRSVLTSLRKIRISDVANPRATLVVAPLIANVGRRTGGSGASVAGDAALVALNPENGQGPKRFVWLRGLYAGDVGRYNANGNPAPSPELISGIQAYCAALNTCFAQIRSRSSTSIYPWVALTSVTGGNSTGQCTITLAATPSLGINLPNQVYFSQVDQKLFPALQGVFPLIGIPAGNPPTITVPYQLPEAGTFTFAKGRLRMINYNYNPIAETPLSSFQSFGTRSTGKNPLGGRGRRSGKRLRLAQ